MLVLTWAVCVVIAVLAAITMLLWKRARRVCLFLFFMPAGIIGASEIGLVAVYFALTPSDPAAALAASERIARMSTQFGGLGGGLIGAVIGFAAAWLTVAHPTAGTLRNLLLALVAALGFVAAITVAGITGAIVVSERSGVPVGWDFISFWRSSGPWLFAIFVLLLVFAFFLRGWRRRVS